MPVGLKVIAWPAAASAAQATVVIADTIHARMGMDIDFRIYQRVVEESTMNDVFITANTRATAGAARSRYQFLAGESACPTVLHSC